MTKRPESNATGARTFLAENLKGMIELIAGSGGSSQEKTIGLELERILVTADKRPVPFSGPQGVSALLERLAALRSEDELVHIDGHLLGLAYRRSFDGEEIGIGVSLEPAAQIEVSVGPARSVRALHHAIESFDRDVEQALEELGLDAHLLAVGYNPFVEGPLDLELIPKERYRDMDAYLSRHGRYARDMMRCSASTQISLDYADEEDAMRIQRLATMLGPVFSFLFDNAPRFRGADTPGMARSRIWRHVDTDRCGIVPESLTGLTFERYARWVSNVKPILFTDEGHKTVSTGDLRARDIMSERPLTHNELLHLLSMVFPNVRLKGFCEFREMDSLPPRLAAACTSFTIALLYDKELEHHLEERLLDLLPHGLGLIDESDAIEARLELESKSWDAKVYGVPVTRIASALVDIARANIDGSREDTGTLSDLGLDLGTFDLEGIDMLARIWDAHLLPRDISDEI
ncbi:MAG: glutamate-cysteine ligase family protein [Collinsella sp.]|nr:glutamate-cysteine ligase family protein [Collinsella sp.]